jgi:citronellol/citronellal dehydrogenase
MQELQDRIAVVTGASRGIGAAIAQRLAAAGATVICAARTLEDTGEHLPGTLRETVRLIESRGGRAVAIRCDITSAESRAALIDQALAQFGRVDILVNNAALAQFAMIDTITNKQLHHEFEADVFAPFDLSQRVLPGMRERKWGRIVNISSAMAEIPSGPPYPIHHRYFGQVLYGATKMALNRLSTGMAAELEETGVAVNTLAPVAAVFTPGVEAALAKAQLDRSNPLWTEEPVEAMAEATLALCLVDPMATSGRNVYSLHYLEEVGRPIRTLDGKAELPAKA